MTVKKQMPDRNTFTEEEAIPVCSFRAITPVVTGPTLLDRASWLQEYMVKKLLHLMKGGNQRINTARGQSRIEPQRMDPQRPSRVPTSDLLPTPLLSW